MFFVPSLVSFVLICRFGITQLRVTSKIKPQSNPTAQITIREFKYLQPWGNLRKKFKAVKKHIQTKVATDARTNVIFVAAALIKRNESPRAIKEIDIAGTAQWFVVQGVDIAFQGLR